MELIHGSVIIQHKKPEKKVPMARRCPHGSDPESHGIEFIQIPEIYNKVFRYPAM